VEQAAARVELVLQLRVMDSWAVVAVVLVQLRQQLEQLVEAQYSQEQVVGVEEDVTQVTTLNLVEWVGQLAVIEQQVAVEAHRLLLILVLQVQVEEPVILQNAVPAAQVVLEVA
jgi:hypothetical protein